MALMNALLPPLRGARPDTAAVRTAQPPKRRAEDRADEFAAARALAELFPEQRAAADAALAELFPMLRVRSSAARR